MKEIKYNAKVIKNLDRARFEELKAKGFVEEDKSFKDDEWE